MTLMAVDSISSVYNVSRAQKLVLCARKQQIEKNKGKANLPPKARNLYTNRDPPIDKPSSVTSISEQISFHFLSKAAWPQLNKL